MGACQPFSAWSKAVGPIWRLLPGWGLESRMTTYGPGHSLDKTKLQFVWHPWKKHRALPDGSRCQSSAAKWQTEKKLCHHLGPKDDSQALSAAPPGILVSACSWSPLVIPTARHFWPYATGGLQANIFTTVPLGVLLENKTDIEKIARVQLFLEIHHDPDCSKDLNGKQGNAYSQGRLSFVQMLANIV